MAKFLVKASYTPEGVKGLLRSGGTARRLLKKLLMTWAASSRHFISPLATPTLL